MRIRFTSTAGDFFQQEHLLLQKVELLQIKKKVEMLATFLPDEILKLSVSELTTPNNYVGVVLFASISGFTQLTEKYNKIGKGGIYRLTATLNAYLGAIVELLYFYGGDVLKFAGDAVLALWKVMPDQSLYEILHQVVVCALVMKQTLSEYQTEINVDLTITTRISCGNMIFQVITRENLMNYILVGKAVNEVTIDKEEDATGDICISDVAWAHMLQERYETIPTKSGVRVLKIFYKPNEASKKHHYDEMQIEVLQLIEKHFKNRDEMHRREKFDSFVAESKLNEQFASTLPPREQVRLAPMTWIVDDLRPFIAKPIQDQVDECQPVEYLTEMRDVTFQRIQVTLYETKDFSHFGDMINEVFELTCRIVTELLGVVLKVWLLGYTAVMLVLFGLRGKMHEMESQNALKCAYRIREALREIGGVNEVSVGVTSGFVYCGVIGHPMRREYTVIGGAVNKAYWIVSIFNGRVTCDYKTYKNSKLSSYYFKLKNVKDKSNEELGLIFEYDEVYVDANIDDKEVTGWEVYGRDREFNLLRSIAFDLEEAEGIMAVCLHGPNKIGKTAILQMALQQFKQSASIYVASIQLSSASELPYFCVAELYRQIYDLKGKVSSLHVTSLINLPRSLLDDIELSDDDIALRKYRVLNYFRDIVLWATKPTIILIDNVEYIDKQSWEILEFALIDTNIRLIMTATWEEHNYDLRHAINGNDLIRLVEIPPLSPDVILDVACQFVGVYGIPLQLLRQLIAACDGRPGYVQCCMLRLINDESIELRYIGVEDKDFQNYAYVADAQTKADMLPVIVLTEKYKSQQAVSTQAVISLDLFDSFSTYQQLVIKTCSVLGEIFTRTLLAIALKYPSEANLADVVWQLFDEEVLDCGSRYVYSPEIRDRTCCRCYFEDRFFESYDRSRRPKYAYCKILHFRNKGLREVAYNLLPGNQRKALHLLCTDVLENMTHLCPECLRNPSLAYFNLGKFKDILEYCESPNATELSVSCKYGDYGNIRDHIRKVVISAKENVFKTAYIIKSDKIRPINDPNMCRCLELLAYNYKELIYHSEGGGNVGKRIYFTMQYGLILIPMLDWVNSIVYLTKARELCMVDAKVPGAQISEQFRKLLVAKIQIGLVKACLDLRQLKTARNHLVIALRQFNVPSVATNFRFFSKLLTRARLSRRRILPQVTPLRSLVKRDFAMCMSLAGTLFSLEGNWKLAKLACSYSIYLFKSSSVGIPILFDVYCSAIDIYRHCHDLHTCEKLQKYVTKELQLNFTNDRTFSLFSLANLINCVFETKCISGKIASAIRLGYRVLDINLRIFSNTTHFSNAWWLGLLLSYNFRLKEGGDLCKMLLKVAGLTSLKNQLQYYSTCLFFLLSTGFVIEPFSTIEAFADGYHDNKSNKFSWDDYHFYSQINLYYLRNRQYQKSDKWRFKYTFDMTNVRTTIVIRTLLMSVEARIFLYLRNITQQNLNISNDELMIENLMKLLKVETQRQYRIFYPTYLVYAAWYAKIRRKNRQAKRLLKKASALCVKQDNYYIRCFILKQRASWNLGYVKYYQRRPLPSYNIAEEFSMNEWANMMYALPVL